MDYHTHQDRVHRNAVPCGAMMKYPNGLRVPAGWLRCTGGPIDPAAHPRLATALHGQLPNDAEWVIKL